MPRKKREDVPSGRNCTHEDCPIDGACTIQPRLTATGIAETEKKQYGKSLVEEHSEDLAILDKLAKQVDIPDDKPVGISLRDQAVLHLLAGADLHRVGDDVIEHRIKRCINIANTVVKLLGEDNAEV